LRSLTGRLNLARASAGEARGWAAALHLASLACSLAFWAYLGRHLWFFDDEWQFLLARGVWYWPGDPRSIWYPHIGHWSTLPILLWRALYNLFHLSSYWPYLLVLLLTAVVVMHLLWRICVRNAVSPLVSAAAVAVVGFLGPGAEDLGWAFQVGFLGSIAFGLGAVLLADGADLRGRARLWVPLCALASLMCSAVGDAMLVALAIVLFARRPVKDALFILAPPLLSYAVWWAFLGHRGLGQTGTSLSWDSFTALPGYVWTGLSTALGRSFNLEGAGGAILLAVLAWSLWALRDLYTQRPAVLALGAGALAFYLLVGLGRGAAGDVGSTAPRYVYVGVALLVPAIACALSGLGPNWPQLAAVVLLLATALGDGGQAQTWAAGRTALVRSLATEIRATAGLLASGVQDLEGPAAAPVGYSPDLTAAQLARLGRSHLLGRLAVPPEAITEARALLQVGLTKAKAYSGHFLVVSSRALVASPGPRGCTTYAPLSATSGAQLVLRSSSARPASVLVLPTSPVVIGATLAPRGGPAGTVPVPLRLAPGAEEHLDDTYAGAALRLQWANGAAVNFCGLARAPGQES